jgi:hypothetical protein
MAGRVVGVIIVGVVEERTGGESGCEDADRAGATLGTDGTFAAVEGAVDG